MSDYIERQAVIDAIHEEFDECVVWDESGERTADEVESIIDRVPSADVVSKTDITALLEETEKELAKGTDEMSIARCFIVSIMGIVKCKVNMMGEKKDG